MEDYGMCCGPEEACQCVKEYEQRRKIKELENRVKTIKETIVFLLFITLTVSILGCLGITHQFH